VTTQTPYQTYQNMMSNPQLYTPMYGYNPYMNMARQQVQQPVQMPVEQPQAVQQQPVQQGMFGKIIQMPENITANDVPMDGTPAVFPLQDFSEIIVKRWDANGFIQTTAYAPILDTKNQQAVNCATDGEKIKIDVSENVREVFETRFNTLENKIDELFGKIEQKTLKTQRKTPQMQKDGDGA
jgi:hypothetical protein